MSKRKDLDTILNKTLSYAKRIAKEFYFDDWRRNAPQSPAFDGETINITREGWEHTIKLERRTKFEVLGRLFVLERARNLLETATAFQDCRKIDKTEYWSFDAVVEGVKIKVIVKSIDSGPKHFLSVVRKGSIDRGLGDE